MSCSGPRNGILHTLEYRLDQNLGYKRNTKSLCKKGLKHSGIALEYPRKHPKFYLDPSLENDTKTRPQTGAEFDRLFVSEYYQLQNLTAQTWQLTSLNRFLVSNFLSYFLPDFIILKSTSRQCEAQLHLESLSRFHGTRRTRPR